MTEYLPGIVEPDQEAQQLATDLRSRRGRFGILTATGCLWTCGGSRR